MLGGMNPKTLLVVYHTMTGGTAQMAQAAAEGARGEPGVQVRLLRAPEAQPEDVLGADGYVFATPENLAAMAGLMKDFFDRCYYAALDRVNGRPYATLICAGSDRLNAIAPALIGCTHAQTPEAIARPKQIGADELAQCRELGAALAAGLALGVF